MEIHAQVSKATTIRDKLTALGISPELGASNLSGLSSTNYFWPYHRELIGYVRKDVAHSSLHYTITTVEEELKPYTNSSRDYRLTKDQAVPTHMVIGVTYGAQFVVTAHHYAASASCSAASTTTSDEDINREQERLDEVFENLRKAALDTSVSSQPVAGDFSGNNEQSESDNQKNQQQQQQHLRQQRSLNPKHHHRQTTQEIHHPLSISLRVYRSPSLSSGFFHRSRKRKANPVHSPFTISTASFAFYRSPQPQHL